MSGMIQKSYNDVDIMKSSRSTAVPVDSSSVSLPVLASHTLIRLLLNLKKVKFEKCFEVYGCQ